MVISAPDSVPAYWECPSVVVVNGMCLFDTTPSNAIVCDRHE
jgi:hypothetical protein